MLLTELLTMWLRQLQPELLSLMPDSLHSWKGQLLGLYQAVMMMVAV